MKIETTDIDGGIHISLSGEGCIHSVKQIRKTLLEALSLHDQVVVDCTRVSEVDLSFLQLFCAAHRSAVSQNKSLGFSGKTPNQMVEVIAAAGFHRHQACSLSTSKEECLWVRSAFTEDEALADG